MMIQHRLDYEHTGWYEWWLDLGEGTTEQSVANHSSSLLSSVMAGKIEVDSYAQPEMYAMLEKIKKSLSLEVPACRMTLEELHDHRGSMYSDKNSLAKAFNYAIEMSNDKQKILEYHETEMLRHSRMYDAVKAEILNGQEFGNQ